MKHSQFSMNSPEATSKSTSYAFWRHIGRMLALIFLPVLLLLGCTISLMPPYDAELLDGLQAANQSALTLFAKLETGDPQSFHKNDYANYADEYARDIAAFQALSLRADARPFPRLTDRIGKKLPMLKGVCNVQSDAKSCLDASGHAITAIVDILRKLRDQHAAQKIAAPDMVQLFEDPYNSNIHTALTIETALKR